MKIGTTILAVFLTLIIWYFSAVPGYYRKARTAGVPVLFSPINPNTPIWMIFTAVVGYRNIERVLPTFIFDTVKLTVPGWEHHCRHTVHARHGKIFILVTPGTLVMLVADPEAAHQMMTRRTDFCRIDTGAGEPYTLWIRAYL